MPFPTAVTIRREHPPIAIIISFKIKVQDFRCRSGCGGACRIVSKRERPVLVLYNRGVVARPRARSRSRKRYGSGAAGNCHPADKPAQVAGECKRSRALLCNRACTRNGHTYLGVQSVGIENAAICADVNGRSSRRGAVISNYVFAIASIAERLQRAAIEIHRCRTTTLLDMPYCKHATIIEVDSSVTSCLLSDNGPAS